MVGRQLATRDGFRIVGAVDVDPAKVGRDVGDIAGLERPLRVKVDPDARHAIKKSKPDVVVLCTSSSMRGVMPQIEGVLKLKVPIVTTTEELSYPVRRNAMLARKIDAMAKRAKVAVLSTGVNPGFVMDALPIMLTVACERIESVTVNRVQDARTRRLPFQQKIGAGLSREQFLRGGRARIDSPCRARRIDLDDCRRARMADRSHHRRGEAEDGRCHRVERVSGRRSRVRERHHPGRRRLPARDRGDHHAHGSLSGRARAVRRSARARACRT